MVEKPLARSSSSLDNEVDFIIKMKGQIIAIEVKAGKKRDGKGLEAFTKKFKAKTLMVTEENFIDMDAYINNL